MSSDAKTTRRLRRINGAQLPTWSALTLIVACSFTSFVAGYVGGYHARDDHTDYSDQSPGTQDRSLSEGENYAAAIHRIGVDAALKNVALFNYQWTDRIRYISASNLDRAFVKDVLYAIWLSGFDCEYITHLDYARSDTVRNSISSQLDNPELATTIGLAGQPLGYAKSDQLKRFIDQGNLDLARRFLLDQLAPLLLAGGRDIATLDSRGATVTCGESRYRVSTSLGSGGILVAAPL